MYPYKRIVIARHERGLLFRDRLLQAVLAPGVHRIADPHRRVEVEIHDISRVEFTHPHLDVLARSVPALLEDHFVIVRLGDDEAGLVYVDGVLTHVLPPDSRRYYWKDGAEVRIEPIDLGADPEVPEPVLPSVLRLREDSAFARARYRYVYVAEVADRHVGLLLVDGRLVRTLESGAVRVLDLRPDRKGRADRPAPAADGGPGPGNSDPGQGDDSGEHDRIVPGLGSGEGAEHPGSLHRLPLPRAPVRSPAGGRYAHPGRIARKQGAARPFGSRLRAREGRSPRNRGDGGRREGI